MRFVAAKLLTRWLAHFFIALAIMFGGRVLAEEPADEEPPAEEPATEEPADAEDESIVSYVSDFLEWVEDFTPPRGQ